MDVKVESLDDVPLIVEFCKKLNLSEVLNNHFPPHGNQKGLSNGELILGWIAHILTTNIHCKSPVNDWMQNHISVMETLLGKKITETDFEDCRLGRVLEKLADNGMWDDFEKDFYNNSFTVLQLNTSPPEDFAKSTSGDFEISKTIKIDSTTAYGHHEVVEDGIMQRGWSKDHRPDLPQLKLMVSVEGNTGYQMASEIVSGNKNDDILYLPIIEKTRKIVSTKNALLCGDSKMSNLSTRADIQKNNEYYLVPVQMHKNEKIELEKMINLVVNESQNAFLIYDNNDINPELNKIIGAGFEKERTQSFQDKGNLISWQERMLLVRSSDHANQEIRRYTDKLNKIESKLKDITSKLCPSEVGANEDLAIKIEKFFENENVDIRSLFEFEIVSEAEGREIKRAEIRKGKKREGSFTLKNFRSKLINTKINAEKFEEIKRKIGWRIYVTNAPAAVLSFASAYRFYRKTMYVIEIGFHVLKDYLQICPLFVRNDTQIIGMTRLLILALKILTLITAEIRANLKKEDTELVGLYAGQPKRKHPSPTGQSVLEYFTRQELKLIGMKIEGKWIWQITPLTDPCRVILKFLRISENCYTSIPEKLLKMG